MNVLGKMVEAVRPGGAVLDLQVIRPDPRVEVDGRVICEIEGSALFGRADAAVAAVDSFVADGRLVEEAVDDHDVLEHYPTGADLVDDFSGQDREVPAEAVRRVRRLGPCVTRERCRLRRLVRPR